MVQISEIEDPFERYCAFLRERDAIYKRKSGGHEWPWTDDPILQTYRFTEVLRERDKTSLHYQKTVRKVYEDDPLVLPATVFYRWFNRIDTCDYFFNRSGQNYSIFEQYMLTPRHEAFDVLLEALNNYPTPHVTGAYIINGKPGYQKGEGVLRYFNDWCEKPWRETWLLWRGDVPTLQEMYRWLRIEGAGLGTFMAAQLVADLKYVPFMYDMASDWWTWAAPGPGSMRGLNAVMGRPMHQSWNDADWLEKIQWLRVQENLELKQHGLGPFHAQDTQNHCCEFSKYEKVRLGLGRPRQVYHV